MSESEIRAIRDRHSLDEAELRKAQQLSAGTAARPVEAYPPHGGVSEGMEGELSRAELADRYEAALAAERTAWLQLGGVTEMDTAAWDTWRSAVEARDKATRLLINHAMAARSMRT
jgi:hypothetical protein